MFRWKVLTPSERHKLIKEHYSRRDERRSLWKWLFSRKWTILTSSNFCKSTTGKTTIADHVVLRWWRSLWVSQGKASLSEKSAASIMKQLLSPVVYTEGCRAPNLKPENLMFVAKENNPVLKIIDFGTSNRIKPGKTLSKSDTLLRSAWSYSIDATARKMQPSGPVESSSTWCYAVTHPSVETARKPSWWKSFCTILSTSIVTDKLT